MENIFNPEGSKKQEQDQIVNAVISKLESSGKLKPLPPKHQVSNNAIRFENPEGGFGPWIQFPTMSGTGADGKFGSGYFPGGAAKNGGDGKPADPNQSIQFNDGGIFGGDPNWLFDKTTDSVTLGTRLGNHGINSLTVGIDIDVSGNNSVGIGNRPDISTDNTLSVGNINVHTGAADNSLTSGDRNTVSGVNTFIGGGFLNFVSGDNACTVGGSSNSVQNFAGFAINSASCTITGAAGNQAGVIGMEDFTVPAGYDNTTTVQHLAIWPLKNDAIHSGRKWFQGKGQTVAGTTAMLGEIPINDNQLVTIEGIIQAIKVGTNESYSATFHAAWKRTGGVVTAVNVGHAIINIHNDLAGPITNSTSPGGTGVQILGIGNLIGDVLEWTASYSTIYSSLGP